MNINKKYTIMFGMTIGSVTIGSFVLAISITMHVGIWGTLAGLGIMILTLFARATWGDLLNYQTTLDANSTPRLPEEIEATIKKESILMVVAAAKGIGGEFREKLAEQRAYVRGHIQDADVSE